MGVPLGDCEQQAAMGQGQGQRAMDAAADQGIVNCKNEDMWPDNSNRNVSNGTVVISMDGTTVTMEKVDEDVETNVRKPRRLSIRELLGDTSDTANNTLEMISLPMDSHDIQEQGLDMKGSAGMGDDTQERQEDSDNKEADAGNSLVLNTNCVVEIEMKSHGTQATEQSKAGTEHSDLEVVLLDAHNESDVLKVNTLIEFLPGESDTSKEKKPRKRKVTVTSINRFCVDQVSLESKSSLKKTGPIISEALSSLHESTPLQKHPRFSVDTDMADNTDDDNDDLVSPDGFDNPGYSASNDEPSQAAGVIGSSPGPQRTNVQHQLPRPGDPTGVPGRKDSLTLMKYKLKQKPKLLKYDESIQQWVERHITVDRAPPTHPRPNDHLPLSCAVLLFCNVLFGTVALFFACEYNAT
jgi:hypothetical protein